MVVPISALVAAATGRGAFLAVPAILTFAGLWRCRRPTRGRARIGLADGLTTARLGAVLVAAALLPGLAASWVLALFSFNVLVDGVDGYVARRFGEVTPFGAVYDRETDAFFVLIAYLYFHLDLGVAAWVLVPGLLPYVYRLMVTGGSAGPPADHREPLAVALAGLNFGLLLLAAAVPSRVTPIVVCSASVVLVSFSVSFWNVHRHADPIP